MFKSLLKRAAILSCALLSSVTIQAQESEDSKYKFDVYGFVRTDFYYNSRDCVAGVNDIFNLYPMDIELDALGEDLNGYSSSGFFAFITRLGVDITGPNIGKATSVAKIEVDFGGYSSQNTILRIRQANIALNWESGSGLVLGQTWHPLYGEVFPLTTNITMGAPFQPFTRTPQICYSYKTQSGIKFIAAALWQLQYLSNGPNGKSIEYQVNSGIPEFFLGANYYRGNWLLGFGADMINIQPRTESTMNGETYRVEELLSAVSAEAHMRYKSKKWYVAAKTIYASALDYATMLGGYGVTDIDSTTGAQSYAPIHNSSTWFNISYGDKWIPSLFVGYTKNLGANQEIVGDIYGSGTDIDQLVGCQVGLKYRRPHWSCSIEYSSTGAWYGDINSMGRVENTHSVFNNRIVSEVSFLF